MGPMDNSTPHCLTVIQYGKHSGYYNFTREERETTSLLAIIPF